jgi:hypothetical protein
MGAYGLGYGIIQGVMGAAAGAGQGIADQALIEEKTQIEALRDQRLSQLRMAEHQAEKTSDLALANKQADDVAARTGKFFQDNKLPAAPISNTASATYDDPSAPGGTASVESNTTTAMDQPSDRAQASQYARKALETGRPEIMKAAGEYQTDVLKREDQDRKNQLEASRLSIEAGHNEYYAALANRANADADAIRSGAKGAKTQLPNIKVERDQASGMTYSVDANSGAVGVMIPGEDAVPEKTHWFKANEPGKPGTPAHMVWTLNGDALPGGLADLYPDVAKRRDNASRAKGIIESARTDDGSGLTEDIRRSASSDSGDASSAAPVTAPRAGAMVNGYRFKGGNPRDKANWEKVR